MKRRLLLVAHTPSRHYCTRKLVRLRKSLKLTNGGKRYTKKEIKPDSVTSERYLLVPLYQAERAWAYAMQLKDEAGPSEVPPRVFFHLVRRFKKAITWCQLLATLADGRVDDKTHLEIEVSLPLCFLSVSLMIDCLRPIHHGWLVTSCWRLSNGMK